MNKYLYLLLFLLSSGCTQKIAWLPVDLLDRYQVQFVATSASTGPMDISSDGRLIAWSDERLHLFDIVSHRHVQRFEEPPDHLAWSPDGEQLAVTVGSSEESRLVIFDRGGSEVFSQRLAGRVGRLQWNPQGGVALSLMKREPYTFGTHLSGFLYQWDKSWNVTNSLLYETTINPSLATHLAGHLHETLDMDISPLGDEILYSRLYAPPAFAPERHLVLRNLLTLEETRVSALPLLNGQARLAQDGESVLIFNGADEIIHRDLWSATEIQTWAGGSFTYDSLSGLILVDQHYFSGQDLLVTLPQDSQTQISSTGKFLVFRWHDQLYYLTGYPHKEEAFFTEFDLNKLRKLRRLRSRGLINQAEYRLSRKRLLQ